MPDSIHPIGISPRVKVIWNVRYISTPKIGRPHAGCISTESMVSLRSRRLATAERRTTSASRPEMNP